MKKLLFLSIAVFLISSHCLQGQSLMIFNGEGANPEYIWTVWRTAEYRQLQAPIDNPKKDAINNTDYCAGFMRMKADPQHVGAALEKLNIDIVTYDSISFIVYKDIPGRVQLEIKDVNGKSYWYKINNDDEFNAGQWNKFNFSLADIEANIETIIISPHLRESTSDPNWVDQMMYFDQVEMYSTKGETTNINTATIVHPIVATELYSINGQLINSFSHDATDEIQHYYEPGVYILKQIDGVGNTTTKKLLVTK